MITCLTQASQNDLDRRDKELLGVVLEALAGLVDQYPASLSEPSTPYNFDLLGKSRKAFGLQCEAFPDDPVVVSRLLKVHLEEAWTHLSTMKLDRTIETYFLTDCHQRALVAVRGFELALELFGFGMSRKEWMSLYVKCLLFALIGEMESYLKFETSYLAACAWSNEELPSRPSFLRWSHREGSLFTGGLHTKIKLRTMIRRRAKDCTLAMSLLRVKEVCMPLSEWKVSTKLSSAVDSLTRTTDPEIEREGMVEQLVGEVRRTVREVWTLAKETSKAAGGDWRPNQARKRFVTPSIHASQESSRKNLGRLGALQALVEAPCVRDRMTSPEGFLVSMRWGSLGLAELRSPYHPDWVDDCDELLHQHMSRASRGPVRVRPAAILEPFKIRVVSAGESLPYQISACYQWHMWKMLEFNPSFRLVGNPFTRDDVAQVVGATNDLFDRYSLVSGDYSAATDNLSPTLSLAALDEYCGLCDVPEMDRLTLMHSLVRHKFEDGREQTWGQLMGSPISFPILCIVNYAVTRCVLEICSGKAIASEDGAIKVNGDDILFGLPRQHYDMWQEWVTAAGLAPSMGKNYLSDRFCMINSIMYDLPKDWCGSSIVGEDIRVVPQLKLGLVGGPAVNNRGQKLSEWIQGPESPWSPYSYGDGLRESLVGFGPEMSRKIVTTSLRLNREWLDKCPPVSWFAHRERGGLGIPSDQPDIREHHLRIAASLAASLDEQEKYLSVMMPGLDSVKSVKKIWLDHLRKTETVRKIHHSVRSVEELDLPLPEVLLHGAIWGADPIEAETDRTFLSKWMRWYRTQVDSSRSRGFKLPSVDVATRPLRWRWGLVRFGH